MKLRTFKKGGIHPAEHKLGAGQPIVDLELPTRVVLFTSQHIGAPSKPVVAKGDHVTRGQKIAQPGGFVSAALHTPISGTVAGITRELTAGGALAEAVVVEASDADHARDMEAIMDERRLTERNTSALSPEQIVEAIGEAGIVGLGGATFPTTVKLTPPKGMVADILIINAAECEPYLTNDHALMLENPREVVEGTRLLMRAAKVERAVIAIEENKADAARLLIEALGVADGGITVRMLKTKYPQGGEKQLIEAVTGRRVADGALPVSVGAVVQNVATAYAVYRAVALGLPLTERIVSVTGPIVSRPGNYRVALGTPMASLLEAAGAPDVSQIGKSIAGGPMMGRAMATVDTFTTKGFSGFLLLGADESRRGALQPCIRCARCVSACPMGLEPYLIATLSGQGRYEEAQQGSVMSCIECGSCMYVCPSNRPILDNIRIGKVALRKK